MTTTKEKPGHMVRKKDRARIRCQHSAAYSDRCNKPADVCEHNHWNTGNTKGVSFWYFCKAHAPKKLLRELAS